MKIYTSYFAKERKLRVEGIIPIGIARFPPRYFSGQNLLLLAPRADMLRMPEEQYDREFMQILAKLNPNQIYEIIKSMAGGRDAALLCFEKSGDPCHRYMVADWLNRELGLDINEFDYIPKRASEAIQGNLF